MNKAQPKIIYTRQPLTNNTVPIPTVKFKHNHTLPHQPSHVKKYLQNVKQHHQEDTPTARVAQPSNREHQLSVQIQLLKANQFRYRQRITELEVQNNEFKTIAKEYSYLTKRNQQLQEQMLLLMYQLEGREGFDTFRQQESPEYPQMFEKQAQSTKQKNFNTEQSSYQELPQHYYPSFKQEPRSEDNPFQNIVIKQSDQSSLQSSSQKQQKLQQIIDQKIAHAMKSFQIKYLNYFHTIEEQLSELKKANSEVKKIKFKDDSASSKSSKKHKYEVRSNVKSQLSKQRQHSKKQLKSEILKLNLQESSMKKSQERQISEINIQLGSQTSSNPSFGKSQFHQPQTQNKKFNSPNRSQPQSSQQSFYYNQPIDQSQIDFSVNPFADKFTSIIMSRVFQGIELMREHLTFVLAEKSKLNDSSIDHFQAKVHKQLKNVIENFFQGPREKINSSSNSNPSQKSQHNKMKEVINELNQQIASLHYQLKQRGAQNVDEKQQKSQSEPSPRFKTLPVSMSCQQFVQTQKRLIKVIEVMKSFNQEYQSILQRSQAEPRPSSTFKSQ